jgi:hypothetical protein
MKLFILLSLSFLFTLSANARKPAVEDFVGVIPESYKETPKGTEVLFDFEKQVKTINESNLLEQSSNTTIESWTAFIGVTAFLALPALMWFFITRLDTKSLATKPTVTKALPTTYPHQDDSRITSLDEYRDNKSQVGEGDDKNKKAS